MDVGHREDSIASTDLRVCVCSLPSLLVRSQIGFCWRLKRLHTLTPELLDTQYKHATLFLNSADGTCICKHTYQAMAFQHQMSVKMIPVHPNPVNPMLIRDSARQIP